MRGPTVLVSKFLNCGGDFILNLVYIKAKYP